MRWSPGQLRHPTVIISKTSHGPGHNRIRDCDAVFQRIFDSIGEDFEDQCKPHAEKARRLQACIKDVLELDIKIRAQEEKSRVRAKESIGMPAKESNINPASTNYILNQYKSHSKPPQTKKE